MYPTNKEKIQSRCKHLKGGHAGSFSRPNPDYLYNGDAKTPLLKDEYGYTNYSYQFPVYAVIKHQLPTGGTLVLCQRCGKEWHPRDPVTGKPATPGWHEAIFFYTDNKESSSIQNLQVDWVRYWKERDL